MPLTSEETITITGTKLRETEKAVQFAIYEVNKEPLSPSVTEWFPYSQIFSTFRDPSSERSEGLVVSAWIVKKKGLI
jgi:hypothetical protein